MNFLFERISSVDRTSVQVDAQIFQTYKVPDYRNSKLLSVVVFFSLIDFSLQTAQLILLKLGILLLSFVFKRVPYRTKLLA